MDVFPACFPLRGARLVVAGSGPGAAARERLLAASPAEIVRLVGAAALDPVRYAGARLAFIADPEPLVRREAAAAARAAGVAVNVLDDPASSDFHTPAIIDRGAIVAAVASAGQAPLLVALARSWIEALLPEGLASAAALLGRRREAIRTAWPELAPRRAALRGLIAGGLIEAAPEKAEALLEAAVAQPQAPPPGRLDLVLAPAAPDLLSLRAHRALSQADVMTAEPGLEAIAGLARRDAERLDWEGGVAVAAGRAASGERVVVIARAEPGELAAAGVAIFRHRPAPEGPSA